MIAAYASRDCGGGGGGSCGGRVMMVVDNGSRQVPKPVLGGQHIGVMLMVVRR